MHVATIRAVRASLVFLGLFSLLAMLSCSGGSGGGGGGIDFGGTRVPVTVMLADAGPEQVIEFHATVGSVQLVNSSGTAQTVLSSSATVEFTHLAASAQLLGSGSAPGDTYTSANATLSNLEVTFIDNTGQVAHASSAGPYNLTATLNATTLAATPVVLTLDVNVAAIVAIDSSNTVTFNTPVLTAAAKTAGATTTAQDLTDGRVLNLDGSVVSVGSTSFAFSGKQLSANVTFNVDSSTAFVDPAGTALSGLSSLAAGNVVEVNAVTQSDGKLLATLVEVEEASTAGLETEGIVTAGTLPAIFDITASDSATPGATFPGLGNSLAVTTATSTAYTFDSDLVDMTGLSFTFDSTHMALGQNVEADTATPSATAITADRLKLQEQAISGTITNTGAGPTLGSAILTVQLPTDAFLTELTKSISLPAGVTSINIYQTASTKVDPSLSIATGLAIRARGLLFWDGTTYQLVATTITPP